MNTLSSDWIARYRFVILFISLVVGFISAYYKEDLYIIPFMGIILFFLPGMLRFRELKGVYYIQIARFSLTCISLVAFFFTYKFLEDIMTGKKSLSTAFDEYKSTMLLFVVIYTLLFLVAIAFGFLWKRIFDFDRVHLRVLINQFSVPIFAFVVLSLSLLSSQKDEIRWYYLLVLPALLIIPWGAHIIGLTEMARERQMALAKFLYFYERNRFESPGKFWELQIYSRRLRKWIILLPLGLLFMYQIFMEKDWGLRIAGLLLVSIVAKRSRETD